MKQRAEVIESILEESPEAVRSQKINAGTFYFAGVHVSFKNHLSFYRTSTCTDVPHFFLSPPLRLRSKMDMEVCLCM